MMRARAKAMATREVSAVIQGRPHCSATYAVVPEPQVGSRTRSPGSVVINTQRSTTRTFVWTTNTLESPKPLTPVSGQRLFRAPNRKSSKYRTNRSSFPTGKSRFARSSRVSESFGVPHQRLPAVYRCPQNSNSYLAPGPGLVKSGIENVLEFDGIGTLPSTSVA